MDKIWLIARFTAKEILQSKILYNVAILGLGLLFLSFIATQFTYGVPYRVALDIGLGALSLSSMAIALFLGSNLIKKEMESRTIYMILSRPVSRTKFILGKVSGLIIVLALNLLLLSSITISLYFFMGGEFQSLILWAVVFNLLEAILILLLVTFFSLVTNPMIGIMFTITLILAGHAINETLATGFVQRVPWFRPILELYHFVLPGFYKLNLKDFVLYKQNIEASYLVGTVAYAFFYSIALLVGSIFSFNRKNLD